METSNKIKREAEKIIQQESWTGEDLGRLLLLIIACDVVNAGNTEYKGIINDNELKAMTDTLETLQDKRRYYAYFNVFTTLKSMLNIARPQVYKFYSGYNKICKTLLLAYKADFADNLIKASPIIMTREQYEKALQEAGATLKSNTETFEDLVFYTLEAYLGNYGNILPPPSIALELEALKKQPAQSELLKHYAQVKGLGYYQLADGRRSDRMSLKEWGQAIDSMRPKVEGLNHKETVKYYREKEEKGAKELYFKGFKGLKQAYKKITGKAFPADIQEAEAMGYLEQVIAGTIEDIETQRLYLGLSPLLNQEVRIAVLTAVYGTGGAEEATEEAGLEWYLYTEPPQGLTMYEFVKAMTDAYRGIKIEGVDAQQGFQYFKKDCPALYKAIESHIREYMPKFGSGDIMNWGELAACNYINYADLTTPTEETVIEQYKGEKADGLQQEGIAILENPQGFQLDQQGNYTKSLSKILFDTINSIYALEKLEYKEKAEYITEQMLNALKYVYAFNALLAILAEIFKVKELTEAEVYTGECEEKAEKFNNLLYDFYLQVHGTQEAKAEKRKLIKGIFKPIELEKVKPKKGDIAITKKVIRTISKKEAAALELNIDTFALFMNKLGAGHG